MFGENDDWGARSFARSWLRSMSASAAFVAEQLPATRISIGSATGEHWLASQAKRLGLVDTSAPAMITCWRRPATTRWSASAIASQKPDPEAGAAGRRRWNPELGGCGNRALALSLAPLAFSQKNDAVIKASPDHSRLAFCIRLHP